MKPQVMIALLLALPGSVAPRASCAQKLLGFGGLEVRAGAANPKNASAGGAYALTADLGYVWRPELRTYVGLDGFLANTDLSVNGVDVEDGRAVRLGPDPAPVAVRTARAQLH
jgi:hypothetical protein